MKNLNRSFTCANQKRRGSVLVLGLGLLIILFAFAALAVDIAFVTTSRAQLQKSVDAAALAANLELLKGWGAGSTTTNAQNEIAARAAAVAVAAANEAAGRDTTFVHSDVDIRFGYRQWNAVTGQWNTQWGVAPYTAVEVTVRRDNPGSNLGDDPLNLFFAPVIGTHRATVAVNSTAAFQAATSTRQNHGRNPALLPITLDVGTWDQMMYDMENGLPGQDNFSYNDATESVSRGTDSLYEINLYPEGAPDLPPGNRGTVDYGHDGNSTSDISRQILFGLNADDLANLGGELSFTNVPIQISGDTGLSAGIEDELSQIIGLPRVIPLFSAVSGPGENATYTIVRYVPIRIMYVKLTGRPSSKRVVIQPSNFADSTFVAGDGVITEESILAPSMLVN